MLMSVMQIRPVPVRMGHLFMRVGVGVDSPLLTGLMNVIMMHIIVVMTVSMLDSLMHMDVRMLLNGNKNHRRREHHQR